ncbi:MarR family transcriptional regulator [Sphingobacterium psychroaquaticum]|uniref:helix-turn-helix transcriptional regulator n=1 Tax=Sphingobacterium psychroaquaticum TaxID=561061 RepID=UPI00106902A2|nr:helix-turn-helix transcriptional regulator [Sphingobacterium psychroaquaticum]QBQ40776.1 MarR family transcriptional regulator [Sphingobacterium psychroaquaticum]
MTLQKEKKDNTDRILMIIKMKRHAPLAIIAHDLGITKEGARQHLIKLADAGLVAIQHKREGVGRPTAYYTLTDAGLARFPDTHAQVTVGLLQSVKRLLGDNALDLLISDREKQHYTRYAAALENKQHIEERLQVLASLRSEEGYMAEWSQDGQTYYFTENHCPICAAAIECQGFCRAELSNFQQLLGPDYEVSRIQHILQDGTRCVYQLKKNNK